MRVALCQFMSTADKDANQNAMCDLIREAAQGGADLAVFPEFAMYDVPVLSDDMVDNAEPLTGAFVTSLREAAAAESIAVVFGMNETGESEGKVFNTLVAIDALGEIVTTYRKQHLYDAFGFKESEYITPGPTGQAVTVRIADTTVGLLTCYDLRFPEASRMLADAGADLILYPAAWVPGPRKEDHWTTLVRARAIENTVYVAAVDQAPPLGVGGSLLVDPSGLVLAELGEQNGACAFGEISHARIETVRTTNPSLENRRYRVEAAT